MEINRMLVSCPRRSLPCPRPVGATATATAAANAVVTALTRKCISVDRGRDRAALRREV